MKTRYLLSFAVGLPGLLSGTDYASDTPVLKDNQAMIQVKGVVCSFCAYGTEKNLSKLSFLDASYFDGDGVLLDINTHRITLALDPSKRIDYGAINQAIIDGGYDPVTVYVRVHGSVSRKDGQTFLTCSQSGQTYQLRDIKIPTLTPSQEFFIQGELLARGITQANMDVVPLNVTIVEESK